MNVDACRLYTYTLPLSKPILVKGQPVSERQGIILELEAGGHIGYGEIAPLEGFSTESLAQAQEQIIRVRSFLLNEPIPEGIELLRGECAAWLGELNLYPSVRFGVEMAALNLKASREGKPLCQLLASHTHKTIPLNGLLNGDLEYVLAQARTLVAEGYKGLKLKVGQNLKEDITKVKALNALIQGKALLHVDANRQWSVEEAIRFGEEVGVAGVTYIEEPFADLSRMHEFYEKTMIPVALDESLREISFDQVKPLDAVDILVLKPSLLGGIECVWQLIRDAKRFGMETLISSIFESSLGIYTLMNIAGCSFRNNAAGLDTLKYFMADLFKTPIGCERGALILKDQPLNGEALNRDYLTPIAF